MGFNVIWNAASIFTILMFLIIFGIVFSMTDLLNSTAFSVVNTTLNRSGAYNTTDPTQLQLLAMINNTQPQYTYVSKLFLDLTQFVVVLTVAFLFISSFSQRTEVFEYTVLFIASVLLSAVLAYVSTEIFNSVLDSFENTSVTINGQVFTLSTDYFFAYFVNNFSAILVLNIVAFTAQFVWLKVTRFGGEGI